MAADATTTTKLRAARPTVALGGKDDTSLTEGLLRLSVAETTTGLYRCEAAFGNWGTVGKDIGFLYFDRKRLDFGKALQIKLGTDQIFDGRIIGLEACFPEGGAPELIVLAEDRLQDLRMTRRTVTFADVTDADVFRRIAGDHGLTASVDAAGPTYKVLAQLNQSDLAFARERARAIDAEVWIDGTTFNVQARRSRNGGSVVLGYGHELREFTVLADLAHQRTAVVASGWDVSAKKGLSFKATEDAIRSELNAGVSGASILSGSQDLGERVESLAHGAPLTRDEAQARAESFFRQSARRFLAGRGVAEADKRLRVGSYVDLSGLGPLFSGKYYLSEVCLLFDGTKGVRTEFTAERPGLGNP
jgi:phage protein D